MKVIITKNYEEMSDKAFEIMAEVVKTNPTPYWGWLRVPLRSGCIKE